MLVPHIFSYSSLEEDGDFINNDLNATAPHFTITCYAWLK